MLSELVQREQGGGVLVSKMGLMSHALAGGQTEAFTAQAFETLQNSRRTVRLQ